MAQVRNDPHVYYYHGEGGEVTVPDGMIAIGKEAFAGSKVTSVFIPKSVKSIGEHAFRDCTQLKKVRIEGSELDIKRNAFVGCTALCELHLPDDFKDASVFGVLKRFAYLNYYLREEDAVNWISDGMPKYAPVKKIEAYLKKYAFNVLKYLVEKNNIETFMKVLEARLLGEIDPDSLEEIAQSAMSAEFRAALLSYKNEHFTKEQLEEFEQVKLAKALGEREYELADFRRTFTICVTAGGYEVGEYLQKNDSVVVPDRLSGAPVVSIGMHAFEQRRFLKQVVIPPTIQKIGEFAFEGCSGLTVMEIPSSVTFIAVSAFRACDGLTSVTIGKGIKRIAAKAFFNCLNLATVYYEGTFGEWLKVNDEGSMLFSNATEAYFQGEKLPSDLVVPEGVKEIPQNAFYGYGGFTTITLPECVHKICSDAFAECKGLTTVTMSASVRRIEDYAFAHCDDLKRINFLGTRKQWMQVAKPHEWARGSLGKKVRCSDDKD